LSTWDASFQAETRAPRLPDWRLPRQLEIGANIGVLFSLYEADGDVRWLYVGVRCVTCGILSCHVDWKIAYGPSNQLIGMV